MQSNKEEKIDIYQKYPMVLNISTKMKKPLFNMINIKEKLFTNIIGDIKLNVTTEIFTNTNKIENNIKMLEKIYKGGTQKQLIIYLKSLGVAAKVICKVLTNLSCKITRSSLNNTILYSVSNIITSYVKVELEDIYMLNIYPKLYFNNLQKITFPMQQAFDIQQEETVKYIPTDDVTQENNQQL